MKHSVLLPMRIAVTLAILALMGCGIPALIPAWMSLR
jgi:hypothetical protein